MNKFMTVQEAAQELGKSVRMIFQYLSDGRLTAYRDPGGRGRPKISRAEVANFFTPEPPKCPPGKKEEAKQ